jgi:hypothetical protein
MNAHGRKKRTKAPKFHPASFGGWPDYQQWADNDFRPRPLEEPEPESEPESEPVVEPVSLFHDAATEVNFRPVPEGPPTRVGVATAGGWRPETPDPEVDGLWVDDDLVVRPYIRTHGRVSQEYDLRLETMLSATRLHERDPGHAALTPDLSMICMLCTRGPQSVAEVSAYLNAPLGVTRVLIGDAIAAGFVLIHQGTTVAGERPSMELLLKVRDGLRRL